MAIPYRHRRTLRRIATVLSVLLIVFVVTWLCWVVWLQRYVVYTSQGATFDFTLSSYEVSGNVPTAEEREPMIQIYFNEGADAIDVSKDMTQLGGYYITGDMIRNDLANVLLQIERLPAGTAVMVEMKGPHGTFFYPSTQGGAVISASTDTQSVVDLVARLKTKGFYTIAQISSLRDRQFGLDNVSSGLYMLNRKGLWMDNGGMYWLDPTNPTTTNYISSVVLELKEMGFNEVLLDNFRFPVSDQYIFSGDKQAALAAAAKTIATACEGTDFVLSFCVEDPAFPLPDGRTRLYLNNVDATLIGQKASLVSFSDPEIRLVFLCETGDTRYDEYSVIRSLNVAEEVEARKGNQ